MHIYAARFVLPVSAPLIPDGAVAVRDGHITQVGPRRSVLAAVGDEAAVTDLGNTALLPGLINAHTHLELSWMAEDPPPGGDYARWLRGLLARREREDPEVAARAAERAIALVRRRGTVAVGDVGNATWIVAALARSGLRGFAFHEVLSMKSAEAESVLEQAIDRLNTIAGDPDVIAAASRLRIGLTPHAPHTTSAPLLRALAGRAVASGEPLSIHVAESACERELLQNGAGPLRPLFDERGFLDEGWTPPARPSIEHLDRLGALSPQTLAVHCVELERPDHATLQSRGVTVVTCPRSNERLGVGRAPVPMLLREGIPVALGTDSLASSPDLDLFAEMGALRRAHPSLRPAAVLRIATLNGARALGLGDELGSLEPGKRSALIGVPLAADEEDPLEVVCSNPATVFDPAEAG